MLAALNAATRHALEDLMNAGKYEYMSDFARENVAKGVAQGKAEGRAEALLQLLAVRTISLSEAQRNDVLACRDLALLERWFARAVTAKTIDEVLAND